MFSKQQTNIQRTLIAGNLADSVGVGTLEGLPLTEGQFSAGEVIIVSEGGIIQDSTTVPTVDKVRFVQFRADGSTRSSDVIDLKSVKRISAAPWRVAAQEQWVVGHNPDTNDGSLEVINNNTYYMRVYDQADSRLGFAQQAIIQSQMVSSAAATQAEIALELTGILTANAARLADRKLQIEMTADATGGVAGAILGNIDFVNGSNVVSYAALAPVVGEYFIVNDIAYQVVSFDGAAGGTCIIDREYTGATSTEVTVNFTQASVEAEDCGVRVTALANSFRSGDERYRMTRFQVSLKDFGTSTLTQQVKADPGVGNYPQVAQLELFCEGNNFHHYRKDFQYSFVPATNDANYSTINLEYTETTPGGIGPKVVSPKVLTVCMELAATTLGDVGDSALALVATINAMSLPNAVWYTDDGDSLDATSDF